MSEHASLRREEQAKAEAHAKRAGYKVGGAVDAEQDRKAIAGAVHKHERHDHKGEPLTPLRWGGEVAGKEGKARPDRRARGGSVKGKGPSKINIIIATGGGEGERHQAMQQGMQVGAKLASAARPPMLPPGAGMPPPGLGAPPPGLPPGAMPPGALPPRPPMGAPGMGMKRGGGVYPLKDAASGGARGRLQKAGMEDRVPVKAHSRRKAGGRI